MQNNKPEQLSGRLSHLTLVFATTSAALIAFAANSVLCRLALGPSNIDPASFTAVRLLSGAITLALITLLTCDNKRLLPSLTQLRQTNAWWGALTLCSYAFFFSFAYVQLSTATGALILFATVQFSMLAVNRIKGNQLSKLEWFGLLVSFYGFVLLVLPEISQPSWSGLVMMMLAGVAWAFYTLAGKNAKSPILSTTQSFVLSIPVVIIVCLLPIHVAHWNEAGLLLAVSSGSLASGVGYALWYTALRHLSISQAAVSQLSVPLIAAIGGVLFVDEMLTRELMFSGALILIGITLVVFKKPANQS